MGFTTLTALGVVRILSIAAHYSFVFSIRFYKQKENAKTFTNPIGRSPFDPTVKKNQLSQEQQLKHINIVKHFDKDVQGLESTASDVPKSLYGVFCSFFSPEQYCQSHYYRHIKTNFLLWGDLVTLPLVKDQHGVS